VTSADDMLLKPHEAADILGITTDYLRRITEAGKVPCTLTPTGFRRYRRGDIEALAGPGWARRRQRGGTGFLPPDPRPTVLLDLPVHVNPDEALFGRRR
jgi:hypothetical protein